MDSRAAFEADANLRWHPDAKGPGLLDRDPQGGYYNTAVEYAWRAWQASRLAALEEAANVFLAEPFACKYGPRRIAMILRAIAQGGGK